MKDKDNMPHDQHARGFRYADGASRRTCSSVFAHPESTRLIVIEGPRASGKSTLARTILNHFRANKLDSRPILFDSHTRDRIGKLILGSSRFALVDEVRSVKRSGPSERGRKIVPCQIDMPELMIASKSGITVILVGENVDLSPDLERRARRIRLARTPEPQP